MFLFRLVCTVWTMSERIGALNTAGRVTCKDKRASFHEDPVATQLQQPSESRASPRGPASHLLGGLAIEALHRHEGAGGCHGV